MRVQLPFHVTFHSSSTRCSSCCSNDLSGKARKSKNTCCKTTVREHLSSRFTIPKERQVFRNGTTYTMTPPQSSGYTPDEDLDALPDIDERVERPRASAPHHRDSSALVDSSTPARATSHLPLTVVVRAMCGSSNQTDGSIVRLFPAARSRHQNVHP